jgi:hypothetical protein
MADYFLFEPSLARNPLTDSGNRSVGGQPHDPIVITTHGGMSRMTSRRAILVQGKAAGSQPGSTRSTVIPPSRGPSTPGATSTTARLNFAEVYGPFAISVSLILWAFLPGMLLRLPPRPKSPTAPSP